MSDIRGLFNVVKRDGGEQLLFWCPGCKSVHGPVVGPGEGPRWTFNGDHDKPVFNPSLLVTWTEPAHLHDPEQMKRDIADAQARRDAGEVDARVPLANKVCHSFIGCNGAAPGQIVFLNDCTHALAGQVAEIPPFSWSD